MKKILLALALSMLLASTAVAAKGDKQMTFVGTIEAATATQDTSEITLDDGNFITFSTRDKFAKQIYNVCGAANKCKITGIVRNNDFLMSIIKIEKVK